MATNRITAAQLKPFLIECGYRSSLIDTGTTLTGKRHAAWTAFAHVPLDTRSACISAIDGLTDPRNDVAACKNLGAPITFVCLQDRIEWWKQSSQEPIWLETIPIAHVPQFFNKHKDQFAPEAIYRAKTWGRVDIHHQLTFVDLGLMPLVEEEAGKRIEQLLVRNVSELKKQLQWPDDVTPQQGKWLLQSVFWLLAAKILRDKHVPRFTNIDLTDIPGVFDFVAEHYGTRERLIPRNARERTGLIAVATDIQQFADLSMLTTEALAYVYEQALIGKETRARLGTHSTPTFLVDYILGNLAPWIKEMPSVNRRIFEPACGHAAFLVASMRLLTELLPENETTPARRRTYLRARLKGCEIDHFALEIARLSLTLADIPNPNGWNLFLGDMFSGNVLQESAKNATVLLGNPPFEAFSDEQQAKLVKQGSRPIHLNQSVEVLARTLPNLPDGGVFGFVLPQSILRSQDAANIRTLLLNNFELREICLFPDKIFTFSDQESTVLLGRKLGRKPPHTHKLLYRRIFKKNLHEFKTKYVGSNFNSVNQDYFLKADAALWVPELQKVWSFFSEHPRLKTIVDVGKGFQFFSRASRPKIIFSADKNFPGSVPGFLNLGRDFKSHILPPETWLNITEEAVDVPREGTQTGLPQVLVNSVRVSRGPWRLTAVIDRSGHAVTDAFTALRPRDNYPLEFIWAICNSPVANAFAYTHAHTRHNPIRLLREMPIPESSPADIKRITKLAGEYLDMVDLGKQISGDEQTAKALHLALDAEVLKLYGLETAIENELLHLFDDRQREGVPFAQISFFPEKVPATLSLNDYLTITIHWNDSNKKRVRLIDKELNETISEAEKSELGRLQMLTDIKLEMTDPLPIEKLEQQKKELAR